MCSLSSPVPKADRQPCKWVTLVAPVATPEFLVFTVLVVSQNKGRPEWSCKDFQDVNYMHVIWTQWENKTYKELLWPATSAVSRTAAFPSAAIAREHKPTLAASPAFTAPAHPPLSCNPAFYCTGPQLSHQLQAAVGSAFCWYIMLGMMSIAVLLLLLLKWFLLDVFIVGIRWVWYLVGGF